MIRLLKWAIAPAVVLGGMALATPAEAQGVNWGIYVGNGLGGFYPPPVRAYHYPVPPPVYRSYWRPPAYYHYHRHPGHYHHHHHHGYRGPRGRW